MKILIYFLILSFGLFGNQLEDFERETRRQEIILDAQKKIANPDNFHESDPILKETKVVTPEKSSETTFIKTIEIKGNTLLEPFEIFYITEPFTNKHLNTTDIFKLIQNLQNTYVKRGFTTTRVSIIESSTPSTLILKVVEGTLGRIYTKENNVVDKIKLWQLFPIKNNSLANDFELRIGLNHLKRLSSLSANTQLEPGFNLGETNILTTFYNVKSPWSFYASFNGVSSTNLIPSFLQITGDNIFGVFDQWKLSYSHTVAQSQNSNSITIQSSLPFRRHLFSASYTYSERNEFDQQFTVTSNIFHSTNEKYVLSDEYTIHYNNYSNLKLTPGVAFKINKKEIGDVEISANSSQQSLASLSLSGSLNGFVNLNGTLTFEKTMPWLNATQDQSNAETSSEHYEFEKWSGSIQAAKSYQIPFIGQTATNVSSSFQTLSEVTPAVEHASLGGWYSVKGYNSNPQYGEHYAVLNTEQMLPISQYNLPKPIKDLNIQLKGFLDAGAIYRKYDLSLSSEKNSLAYAIGGAIGIGMSLFNGQFDYKLARGIDGNIRRLGYESFWTWSIQF